MNRRCKILISDIMYDELIEGFPELVDVNKMIDFFMEGNTFKWADNDEWRHTIIKGLKIGDEIHRVISHDDYRHLYVLGDEDAETLDIVISKEKETV